MEVITFSRHPAVRSLTLDLYKRFVNVRVLFAYRATLTGGLVDYSGPAAFRFKDLRFRH